MHFQLQFCAPIFICVFISIVCDVKGATKQKQSATCGVPSVIPGDARTISPWSAAIFVSAGKNKNPRFYTNGVIIGPTTIVSVGGGPYGTTQRGSKTANYTITSANFFLVGAGINTTDFNQRDNFAQFSRVTFVEPYTNHEPTNEYYHYFVYHLKTPLNFTTPYVKEICIPLILKNRSQSPYGWQLVQAGFSQSNSLGTNPNLLKAWKVTTGPLKLCESLFRYHYKRELAQSHTFCSRRDVASTKRGTPFANIVNSVDLGEKDNNLCHMHGSSLAFELGGIWYLASLVSLLPGRKRGRCSHKSFYLYGNFVNSLDWTYGSYTCSPNKYACKDKSCIPLGSVCNGVKDCPDGMDEDETFCRAQNICRKQTGNHSCGIGQGCIADNLVCNSVQDCPNGADESPKLCQQQQQNSGLTRVAGSKIPGNRNSYRRKNCGEIPIFEGMVATCRDGMSPEVIDCKGATFPGVFMKMECGKYAIPRYGYDYIEMTCSPEGEWLGQRPFSCDQECGIIREGQFSNQQLPWHASILTYQQADHVTVCGATLIEKSFLLTSASCVETWKNPGARELFKVLLNPVSTKVTVNLQSESLQVFPVKQIWISPEISTKGGEAGGIAMIELQTPAQINGDNKPTPACYIQSFRKLISGRTGLVSGFGIGNDGVFGDPIKVLNATVVSNEECENAGTFNSASNSDAFCTKGASLCNLDVGGGIFFPEKVGDKTLYMLKGIATPASGDKCPDNKYQHFTPIDLFSDWILDILESFS